MQPAAAPPPPPRSTPAPPRTSGSWLGKMVKIALLAGLLLGAAFAAGYVPQKQRAEQLDETLEVTKLDLALATAHRDLGVAALESQRSNYANAAIAATRFFDSCARLATHPGLANQPRTRLALGAYATQRDQIAVQLGTADPSVAQRLASLYFTMDGVLARRE
ncbi:MAG TPA: hypothetical protein VEU30_03435 [Thermoanaerobaculia bacterium]|nr:hypothetical protein [Thermoanaerobaculia bacterium]